MKILDILFPKQCLGCAAWDSYLCQSCVQNLRCTNHQRCIVCQKPSLFGYTHEKCLSKNSPNRLITIFSYNQTIVAKIINNAKTSYATDLVQDFSAIAFKFLKITHPQFHQFTISAIPITRPIRRFRGFNHSEIIGIEASKYSGLPIDNLLLKIKPTKPQKSLNKYKRSLNLKNCFRLKSLECLPSHVLLIDDVTTTGTTLLEATKVLKMAGVKVVWCLALAQD